MVISQNAYKHPTCPLEPILQSLHILQPTFNLNQTDLICDRNNLRRLLGFASGDVNEKFEIIVEVVNNTVLFIRLDGAISEHIDPAVQFRGFGHTFEKVFTKRLEAVEKTVSHHRVVGYTFGGLKLVVRFEADGAVYPSSVPESGSTEQLEEVEVVEGSNGSSLDPTSNPSLENEGNDNPPLPAATGATTPGPSSARIFVLQAGHLIPQRSIIEIKTRNAKFPTTIQQNMPQLWFSNTRHLYVGLHHWGAFVEVKKHTVSDGINASWESSMKEELGKLADLLGRIIEAARGNTSGARMRVRCSGGTLKLEDWDERETPEILLKRLPIDLREMWTPGG